MSESPVQPERIDGIEFIRNWAVVMFAPTKHAIMRATGLLDQGHEMLGVIAQTRACQPCLTCGARRAVKIVAPADFAG